LTLVAARKKQAYWALAIAVTAIISIYSTIYSLTHGIHEVFSFLYFLPIILFVYIYPHRGIIFSLIISTVYLLLVYISSATSIPHWLRSPPPGL